VQRSNLLVRVATSLVAVPLLLGVLLLGPALLWYGVVLLAVLFASAELFGMTHCTDRVAQGIGVLTSLAVSATLYFGAHDGRVLLTLLVATTVGGLLVQLWRLGEIATVAGRMMASVAGPLYTGGLLTTLGLLRRDLGNDGAGYVVLALALAGRLRRILFRPLPR
jgi:CDP-diglyceride synthetase